MTFFDPGSVTWIMCVIGLAGGAVARPARPHAGILAALVVALPAAWAGRGAGQALGAQIYMIKAAEVLAPGDDVGRRREVAAGLLVAAHDDQMPTYAAPLEAAADQLILAAAAADPVLRHGLIDRANALGGPDNITVVLAEP